MLRILGLALLFLGHEAMGFTVLPRRASPLTSRLASTKEPVSSSDETFAANSFEDPVLEQQVEALVDDDEWNGMTMQLTDVVSRSVIDDVKKYAKDFLGQDEEYKLGDISRAVDNRVKTAVANLRGKEDYEIGDLVAFVTEQSLHVAEQATGARLDRYKELSKNIDKRVKSTVTEYTGKANYKSGDLAKAVAANVKTRVADFADHYELSHVAEEILNKRKQWASKVLGSEFVENFNWKELAMQFTGKDDYAFGDVSKKVVEVVGQSKKVVEEQSKKIYDQTMKYMEEMFTPKPDATKPKIDVNNADASSSQGPSP